MRSLPRSNSNRVINHNDYFYNKYYNNSKTSQALKGSNLELLVYKEIIIQFVMYGIVRLKVRDFEQRDNYFTLNSFIQSVNQKDSILQNPFKKSSGLFMASIQEYINRITINTKKNLFLLLLENKRIIKIFDEKQVSKLEIKFLND